MLMASKHLERCSTSFFIKEMQIKTTTMYHITPIRMLFQTWKIQAGEEVESQPRH